MTITALVLLGAGGPFIAGCGGHDPAPVSQSTGTAVVRAGEATAENRSPPEAPPLSWAYAHSPEALHRAHVDRVARDAEGEKDKTGLIPFANAFEWRGAAWGLEQNGIAAVTFREGEGNPIVWPGRSSPHARAGVSRKPDAGEQRGLAALENGEAAVRSRTAAGVQVVGALRNTGSCQRCHDQPPGTLLGALVYRFREIHDD